MGVKNKFLLILLLKTVFLYSQSFSSSKDKVTSIIKDIRSLNFDSAKKKITSVKFLDHNLYRELILYYELNTYRGISPMHHVIKFKKPKTDIDYTKSEILSLYNLNMGIYDFYMNSNTDSKTFEYYNIALGFAQKTKNKILICEIIKAVLNYYSIVVSITDREYEKYLDIYEKNIYDELEKNIYTFYKNILPFEKSSDPKIIDSIVPKLFELSKSLKLKPYLGRIYIRIGNYYRYGRKMNDSAKFFYQKSISLFKNPSKGYLLEQYIKSKSNYARILTDYKKYNQSNKILYQLDSSYTGKLHNWNKVYINYYISYNYKGLQKYDSAFKFLNKSRLLEYNLNQKNQLQVISDLNTKYQTKEKEKEIIQQKQQIKYLIIGIFLFVSLGSTIGYLTLKNSRRKRLLAIQEKELETQKNLTFLKEQEITTINAMVEGQEKERKRVAEDLHDNLGSVIATLKLHFDNLRLNREKKKINQDTLFDKTEGLIDEAYLKVRSIAHAKNAGMIANQGLLIAIQMMAEKISSANAVQIDVVHSGLKKPIENSLEIGLFRIIQELIANIIKHAKASNATIDINQHENRINIIVDDNGKGMKVSQINIKKGMGLHSIRARVEHLNGSFTIDSTPTRGTTIIMDIPI